MSQAIIDEIKRQWVGHRCYINGAPARIIGNKLRFAIIRADNAQIPDTEWSWYIVDRIMRSGGFFTTDF